MCAKIRPLCNRRSFGFPSIHLQMQTTYRIKATQEQTTGPLSPPGARCDSQSCPDVCGNFPDAPQPEREARVGRRRPGRGPRPRGASTAAHCSQFLSDELPRASPVHLPGARGWAGAGAGLGAHGRRGARGALEAPRRFQVEQVAHRIPPGWWRSEPFSAARSVRGAEGKSGSRRRRRLPRALETAARSPGRAPAAATGREVRAPSRSDPPAPAPAPAPEKLRPAPDAAGAELTQS